MIKSKTFLCKNCGEERKRSHQTTNTYCNNICQHEYQYKHRIKQWLQEDISWSNQVPNWAKRWLFEQRGYTCEICNITEWNGKNLVLECDHIDGHYENNNPSNLRMVCPNCHSQTDTYKAKNTGNGRPGRK